MMIALFVPPTVSLFSQPAHARNASVYTLTKVKIDAQADNAVVAKKQAMEQGPVLALRQIFKRFAPFRAYDRLPTMTSAEADKVIDGFAVRSERNSSTRYIALLDYNFSRKKLQSLLIKKGVPFFDGRSPKQVVMPVYDARNLEKSDQKYWWRAWRTIDLKHGLTDTRLYRPKMSDQEAWQKLREGEQRQYGILQERYSASKLILIEVQLDEEQKHVTLRIFGEDVRGPVDYRQEIPIVDRSKQTYETIARIAYGILEGRWREPQITGDVIAVSTSEEGLDTVAASKRLVEETVFLRVSFRGLRGWQRIRKKLQRIPGVQKMQVNSLSPRGADVRLLYPGGIDRLQAQLVAYGLRIEQQGNEAVLRALR